MAKSIEVTDSTFEEEVIKSDIPVLVDFWAVWCGPCKMIHPIIDELADEYDGKLKVARLDVDKNNQTASQYRIMSIPSLLFGTRYTVYCPLNAVDVVEKAATNRRTKA